jgi:deoxyribodipyrimidine photo-lyase
MTKYNRALHIFRRDLRLQDNTALNAACEMSKEVVTCFIFNDAQVKPHRYRSVNGLAFMVESLEELSREIEAQGGNLLILHGNPERVIDTLISELSIDAVFVNKDYTPFSSSRDATLQRVCASRSVPFHSHFDLLLVDPESFSKDDGRPYTVYTPFFKKAQKLSVPHPSTASRKNLLKVSSSLKTVSPRDFWPSESAPNRVAIGGRSKALAILKQIKDYSKYDEERNIPGIRGTTLLAPHNKFGTVSIREVFHAVSATLGAQHTLIRELYWRDFFTHIAWHFPHVFGHAFNSIYDAVEWNENDKWFERWCRGQTGFPIVDAGMRELVTTGFMHNRVRMIVASFLVKDLHISWQRGEEFFAQHLTDYDPAVNNGSWQWAASTGCDAQPYFRIFNPWLQQERFDPECVYVKKWLPELNALPSKKIHSLYEAGPASGVDYPSPMVDHSVQKIHAEEMFRKCQKNG